MTDRGLLEMAAKAAGIDSYRYCNAWKGMAKWEESDGGWFSGECWNPLNDDGDALRLAVKLRLCVDNCIGEDTQRNDVSVSNEIGLCGSVFADERHNGGPYAATRRAIVLAAAEIGKVMP